MGITQKIKETWKKAIKSGKILKTSRIVTTARKSNNFEEYVGDKLNDNIWKNSEHDERHFRESIASNKEFYTTFECKGDYKLWFTLTKLLVSVFYEKNGQFKEKKQNDRRWSSSLVKFVNRILKSFPLDTPTENNINDLRSIEKKLEYVKSTIQP